MTADELRLIIEAHYLWLNDNSAGKRADLQRANLRSANLRSANLRSADLQGAKNVDALTLAQTEIQPREGEIIGWKKCIRNVLVKLRVPADSKRSNALGGKCRAEFVQVIEVIGEAEAFSIYDKITRYAAMEIVRCDSWNPDRLIECGGGIHYYLTREEAEAHN